MTCHIWWHEPPLQASVSEAKGKRFTTTHIDVAWLGAQCCLPHERKQEREMRGRKTEWRCVFNVCKRICFWTMPVVCKYSAAKICLCACMQYLTASLWCVQHCASVEAIWFQEKSCKLWATVPNQHEQEMKFIHRDPALFSYRMAVFFFFHKVCERMSSSVKGDVWSSASPCIIETKQIADTQTPHT